MQNLTNFNMVEYRAVMRHFRAVSAFNKVMYHCSPLNQEI